MSVFTLAGKNVNVVVVLDGSAAENTSLSSPSVSSSSPLLDRDQALVGGVIFDSFAWILASNVLASIQAKHASLVETIAARHQHEMDALLLDDNMEAQRRQDDRQEREDSKRTGATTLE